MPKQGYHTPNDINLVALKPKKVVEIVEEPVKADGKSEEKEKREQNQQSEADGEEKEVVGPNNSKGEGIEEPIDISEDKKSEEEPEGSFTDMEPGSARDTKEYNRRTKKSPS